MALYLNKYRVESAHLQEWDYSQDAHYFVTICTKNFQHLFGAIANDKMCLNAFGEIVWSCWKDLPSHYHNLCLDEFIVMPNHVHGILIIDNCRIHQHECDLLECTQSPEMKETPKNKHGLFEFVRALKCFSARRINELRNCPGTPIWQKGFYEHIIRDEKDYNRICEYIIYNPQSWDRDKNNR